MSTRCRTLDEWSKLYYPCWSCSTWSCSEEGLLAIGALRENSSLGLIVWDYHEDDGSCLSCGHVNTEEERWELKMRSLVRSLERI